MSGLFRPAHRSRICAWTCANLLQEKAKKGGDALPDILRKVHLVGKLGHEARLVCQNKLGRNYEND